MSEASPPSRWLVLSVSAPSGEAGALLTEGLLALGGRAVQEEEGRLVTHLPPPPPGTDLDAFVRTTTAELRAVSGLPTVHVQTRWQEQEEWAEVWKRGLGPRRVTGRVVVTPSWCEPEARPGDLVIVLDPGMAFGNAEHGTTRGCLRLLDRVMRGGERILDVGAGSGVLSIAAARMGAAEVLAVEGDPWAVAPARENVERNGVADRVAVGELWATPEALGALGLRDGVIANIESGVLRSLIPGLVEAVRPGGWLLMSGILDHEWPALRGEVEARGLRFAEIDEDGEWRSARFDRP